MANAISVQKVQSAADPEQCITANVFPFILGLQDLEDLENIKDEKKFFFRLFSLIEFLPTVAATELTASFPEEKSWAKWTLKRKKKQQESKTIH